MTIAMHGYNWDDAALLLLGICCILWFAFWIGPRHG